MRTQYCSLTPDFDGTPRVALRICEDVYAYRAQTAPRERMRHQGMVTLSLVSSLHSHRVLLLTANRTAGQRRHRAPTGGGQHAQPRALPLGGAARGAAEILEIDRGWFWIQSTQ